MLIIHLEQQYHHQMETMNNLNHELKFQVLYLNLVVIEIKKYLHIHFHLVKFFCLFIYYFFECIFFKAEQATIDQQQNVTPRAPSSPQPQISPQIRSYVSSLRWLFFLSKKIWFLFFNRSSNLKQRTVN